MTARSTILILATSLALAPALVAAQNHAVPRGGGGGGGGASGGGSHPSPGVQSSGSGSSSTSGSSSSGSGSSSGSTAEQRHPRPGHGHYPGYPGYPGYYPGWGWAGGLYWGSWWPYGAYGWYGYGYPWGWSGSYPYYEGAEGSMRVLVNPAEARVYVDGYYAGTVDDFDGLFQRLHVPPGRHEITLKLEGYKTHRMRVFVSPNATVKLHYDLEKGQGETFEDLAKNVPENEVRRERDDGRAGGEGRPWGEPLPAVGTLHLNVRPADASVYVDGAFRGSAREASSLRLPPGKHRIEVVRPGYRTQERDVDVTPGAPTDLTIELERPSV